MKILTVVGARPQFIKAFAVSRQIRPDHDEILVHTGQHYDEELSSVFFEELGLPEPEYNLGVGSGSHGEQTAAMLTKIESIVESEEPDTVLLYGDTNSTLAGAIASAKLDPTIAHVEAGLRSYNRDMPEEINRILTDHVADLLFPPSESAAETLANEGIVDGVHVVGDVMYDAIRWARDVARRESDILSELNLAGDDYILVTVHRAENTDNRSNLESILDGLAGVEHPIVFPVHPRTAERLRAYGLWEETVENFHIIDPVGYLDFVRLLDDAIRVGTDSGGVQKEAFFLDTPCVTFRSETEWVETVESGWNVLVGTTATRIADELNNSRAPDVKPQPYGDGHASEKIAQHLRSYI